MITNYNSGSKPLVEKNQDIIPSDLFKKSGKENTEDCVMTATKNRCFYSLSNVSATDGYSRNSMTHISGASSSLGSRYMPINDDDDTCSLEYSDDDSYVELANQ